MKIFLPLLLALLLSGTASAEAELELEVFSLTYSDAEQIIPLLKPHLRSGSSLSGHGQRLLLRAERAEVEHVRALLAQLDQPPQALRISIRGERSASRRQTGGGLDEQGNVRIYRDSGRSGSAAEYSVQGLAGRPVHIGRSTHLRVTEMDFNRSGASRHYRFSQGYVHAHDGFYARASFQGEGVTVEISVAHSGPSHAPSAVRQHELVTQVHGGVGEWLLVADDATARRDRGDTITHRSGTRGEEVGKLWLRVERLRQD
jgi:hypothetical protein